MGETLARRPGLPKFLGDCVIHLRRLLLCHSPRLMGVGLTILRQFYAAEMFSCRVPGMMRQPSLERRARHPVQSCPSVLRPCFEQSSPYPEPTLMSHGVSFRVPMRTLALLGTKPTTSSRFLPEIFACFSPCIRLTAEGQAPGTHNPYRWCLLWEKQGAKNCRYVALVTT